MSERENILGRIREALRVPARKPSASHNGTPPASLKGNGSVDVRPWLPPPGFTFDEHLALFRKNATDLKAEFHTVANRDELKTVLLRLRDAEGWKKMGFHHTELTGFAVESLALPVCRTDQGYEVRDLESCSAGISECDALVAQTGSVLITSRSAGGRALSVLPPHHVVLARHDQLLGDLPDALELLKKKYGSTAEASKAPPTYPSFVSFITGPSRTGDIERILVLGAHGPRKLTILFLLGE